MKKIKVDDLKRNMVLARDVVTESGQVIFPRETLIGDINLSVLYNNNIDYVYVKEIVDTIPTQQSSRVDVSDELDYLLKEYEKKNPDVKAKSDRELKRALGELKMDEDPTPITSKEDFKRFEKLYDVTTEDTKNYISAVCSGQNIMASDLYDVSNKIMQSLNVKSDVFSFIGALKETDVYTHANNVSLLCNLFGYWLNLNDQDLQDLTIAGLMHDIGKTNLPKELVIGKNLTPDQKRRVRNHTTIGYEMLSPKNFSEQVRRAVLMHHEKPDGSGYPSGLKGEEISDMAKIVAICNNYEYAISDDSGEGRRCPFDVIHDFELNGYATMDPKYLWVFMNKIVNSFVGMWVKLSNGMEAKVVFIHKNNLAKPIVQTADGDVIDISANKDLFVKSIL